MELVSEILLTVWIVAVGLRLYWNDKAHDCIADVFDKLLKWAREKKQ